MSWFDEQLRYRKEKDDENFAESIDCIANAVMGKRLSDYAGSMELARSAIEEILKYYHCKMKTDELPPQADSLDEQLEYRMRPFGIMRRTVMLDKGWYVTPAVTLRNFTNDVSRLFDYGYDESSALYRLDISAPFRRRFDNLPLPMVVGIGPWCGWMLNRDNYYNGDFSDFSSDGRMLYTVTVKLPKDFAYVRFKTSDGLWSPTVFRNETQYAPSKAGLAIILR